MSRRLFANPANPFFPETRCRRCMNLPLQVPHPISAVFSGELFSAGSHPFPPARNCFACANGGLHKVDQLYRGRRHGHPFVLVATPHPPSGVTLTSFRSKDHPIWSTELLNGHPNECVTRPGFSDTASAPGSPHGFTGLLRTFWCRHCHRFTGPYAVGSFAAPDRSRPHHGPGARIISSWSLSSSGGTTAGDAASPLLGKGDDRGDVQLVSVCH